MRAYGQRRYIDYCASHDRESCGECKEEKSRHVRGRMAGKVEVLSQLDEHRNARCAPEDDAEMNYPWEDDRALQWFEENRVAESPHRRLPVVHGNEAIPPGHYCYEVTGEWRWGCIPVRTCPFWTSLKGDVARCNLTCDQDSKDDGGVLWDKVKTCALNEWQPLDALKAVLDEVDDALSKIPEEYEEQRASVARMAEYYRREVTARDGEADEW